MWTLELSIPVKHSNIAVNELTGICGTESMFGWDIESLNDTELKFFRTFDPSDWEDGFDDKDEAREECWKCAQQAIDKAAHMQRFGWVKTIRITHSR